MRCNRCGYQNPQGSAFCGGCGQPLPQSQNSPQPSYPSQPKKPKTIALIVALVCFAVVLLLGFRYFFIHDWTPATCTTAQTCTICEKTRGISLGHQWSGASCTSPDICTVCGATSGTAVGHQWSGASCTSPDTCSVCGTISGGALGHQWKAATCTEPETCAICNATSGSALGHQWTEATRYNSKTCLTCGATEGSAIVVEPVFINELPIQGGRYGRLWTRSTRPVEVGFEFTNEDAPECWSYFDPGINGHTPGIVRDNMGNEYTYGIHIDGNEKEEYFFGYWLESDTYTTFSGTVACPEKSKAISDYVYNTSTAYTKYFEVYGDGVLLYTSPSMRYDFAPQHFSIDITGVTILKIVYPATVGPNEIATIYDGMLS